MSTKIIIDAFETIACQHCSKEFALQEGITSQLIERYESEYKSTLEQEREKLQKITLKDAQRAAAEKYDDKIQQLTDALNDSQAAENKAKKAIEQAKHKAAEEAKQEASQETEMLQAQLDSKDEALTEMRGNEIQLRKDKVELEDKQKSLELEVTRKVDVERVRINSEVAEEYKLKEAELQKKIDDAQKANEDMKRKLEQGSQQTQGEVLELELEDALKDSFPLDLIDPVRKGARGADVIQTVKLRSGAVCGKIVWETKRAENWSNSWIPKLKDDQHQAGGEIAVLVTTAFPAGVIDHMLMHEGVWMVRPELAKPLAEALRTVLIESHRQKAISTGKSEKIEALYDYICSAQFAQKVRSIVDTYQHMQDDLIKEKAAMQRLWKKREAQIDRITTNMMGMCGELQGVSGAALPQLEDIGALLLDEES